MEQMITNRNEFQPNKNKPKKENKDIPHHQLCNGPAKLCISLNITKDQCNKQDLSKWSEMWIEEGNTIPEEQIVKSRRIGIDSAGPEWANKLLHNNPFHQLCPASTETWCNFKKAKDENKTYSHKKSIADPIMTAIKAICQALSHPDLLRK
ncbi:hypothetical protein J6590_046660 [Homalodisca vitripennis]|nr:hypothetical protein J6590_046660 [Homalodisca vitripennis]